MGFTENKFKSLNRINRLKKTGISIREYLHSDKNSPSPVDLVRWLNDCEGTNYPIPQSDKEWGLLSETIFAVIGEESFFTPPSPFDTHENGNLRNDIIFVLDNIRSPHNCGSILRSAGAYGIARVIITGFTPDTDNPKVRRVSMGSPVSVVRHKTFLDAADALRSEGFRIVAMERCRGSVSLHDFHVNGKTAFVMGNEEFGIPDESLAMCDGIVHIDLPGVKHSLNVSVAAGLVMNAVCSAGG